MNQIVIQILGETKWGQLVPSPMPCEFALECESFAIGSKPETTPCIKIDNSTLSRRHIVVASLGNDRWRVCDAHSDNGTMLVQSDRSPEEAFFDRDWRKASRRITVVDIVQPTLLLIGAVVIRLVPVASPSSEALRDVIADISARAQQRGLTPEILQSILEEPR